MEFAARIMLAEDDEELRSLLADVLRMEGYEVIAVEDGGQIKAYVDDYVLCDLPKPRVDLLLTDIRMPEMTGMLALSYLRDLGVELPVVILTAFSDEQTRQTAATLGAHAVLDKPVDIGELSRTIRAALQTQGEAQRTTGGRGAPG